MKRLHQLLSPKSLSNMPTLAKRMLSGKSKKSPAPATPSTVQKTGKSPISLVEAVQRFETKDQSFSDVPVNSVAGDGFELHRLALGFQKYKNFNRALVCLDHVPAEKRQDKHWRLRASILSSMCRFEEAFDEIKKVTGEASSYATAQRTGIERANILRMLGRYDEAHAEISELMLFAPNSLEVGFALAELKRLMGDQSGALEIFRPLIECASPQLVAIERYLDFLFEANKLERADQLAAIFSHKFKGSIVLSWKQARIAWNLGNQTKFNEQAAWLAGQFKKSKTVPLAAVNFISGIHPSEGWEGVQLLRESVVEHLDTSSMLLPALSNSTLDWAISQVEVALSIGDNKAAGNFSKAIVQKYRFVPRAWFAYGQSALEESDKDTARKCFERSLALDPSHPAVYAALFSTILEKPESITELHELIEKRNKNVPKFNDYYPDRRLRYYDHESFFLNLREGKFRDAYAIRNNQPPNRVLESKFPDQYRALKADALPDTGQRMDRVAIIGQDGVSDEIRWAMYYHDLNKYFDRVAISCDPRLLPIFQRSFPTYHFTGVARRWPSIPWRAQEAREEISQINLAGKLSNDFYHELASADRIMFPEEIALHTWAANNVDGPSPEGCFDGAYLVPQADRKAHWREKLSVEAKGKLKVGLLWRSALDTSKRSVHFLSVKDMASLTDVDCHFVCLQPLIREDEMAACKQLGIKSYPEVDLYDDFEEIAALTSELDLVIGISTLPMEIAGACGTECWVLTMAPQGKYLRLGTSTGNRDLNTANATVYTGDIDGDFTVGREVICEEILKRAQSDLRSRVVAAANQTDTT